ncbi:hypothetical protein HispidOSU_004846, partial [Sigmodon hispidus]
LPAMSIRPWWMKILCIYHNLCAVVSTRILTSVVDTRPQFSYKSGQLCIFLFPCLQ